MGPVHPGVRCRRELDQARPHRVVEPVGRCPAAVAVSEAGLTVGRSGKEAPDLAGREGEDGGSLLDRQATVHDMLEHERSMLGPGVGRGRFVLGFHARDGDKVAGRLARIHRSVSPERRGNDESGAHLNWEVRCEPPITPNRGAPD